MIWESEVFLLFQVTSIHAHTLRRLILHSLASSNTSTLIFSPSFYLPYTIFSSTPTFNKPFAKPGCCEGVLVFDSNSEKLFPIHQQSANPLSGDSSPLPALSNNSSKQTTQSPSHPGPQLNCSLRHRGRTCSHPASFDTFLSSFSLSLS